jgi:glutamyl-tRNA reductase
MSGGAVSRALLDRFEAIRQAEVERLDKKLRGLNDDDRRVVEAITADVVQAIAGVPARALSDEVPGPALAALVRLFALDGV